MAFADPMQHPLVVGSRTLEDLLFGYCELCTAYVSDVLGHLVSRHLEELHVVVCEEGSGILLLDVLFSWIQRVDTNWAARVI